MAIGSVRWAVLARDGDRHYRHIGTGVAHAFISVRALPAAMMRSEALFAKNLKFSGGRFSAESNHNLLNYSTVPPTVAS